MAATPMDIRFRPFSVEPFTNIMLPDGIFDAALRRQQVTCYYTNVSDAPLDNVRLYLEGIGDPGIVPTPRLFSFARIAPGASVRIGWLADFTLATPGKKLVSFVAQAEGMDPARALRQIFVSKTERDSSTGEFRCAVPEGTLVVSRLQVIGPRDRWRPCSDRDEKCRPSSGPWIPARVTMTFVPNPAYAGTHGDLPFGDPWWKVVGWIVFVVAALVAVVAAALGAGTASITVGGTFEETTGDVECCTPEPGGALEDGLTVAGVASAIAGIGLMVGLADDEDPWWRGQEATPPAAGLLTLAESVDVVFDYPGGAPRAGEPTPVHVNWTYTRSLSDGTSQQHAVDETRTNVHVSGGVEVETPAVHHAFAEPLVIKARFKQEGDALFAGEALYAFSLLRSPDDIYFVVPLIDDGQARDEQANDGTYTGSIHLEELYPILLRRNAKLAGLWHVYVFAQDVNQARPDMLPEIAAKEIGGFMVASGIQITFNPNLPCPLQAQATVNVVV